MADDPNLDDVIDIDMEEDEGDSDDDSDDGGVLFQQPTILSGSAGHHTNHNKSPKIPVAPPAHFSWQQDAIIECFLSAAQSHDADSDAFQDMPTWNAPPFFPEQQQQQQPETTTDAGDPTGMGKDDDRQTITATTTTTTNNCTGYPMNNDELTGWEPVELQLPPWAKNSFNRYERP